MGIRIASIVLTVSGVVALVLGIVFWLGQARQFIPLHTVLGVLVVLSLWSIAGGQAISKRGSWRMVLSAVLVGALVLFVGMQQASLLPGPFHWVIQLIHLLLGALAVGIGRSAAARVGQRETATVDQRGHPAA